MKEKIQEVLKLWDVTSEGVQIEDHVWAIEEKFVIKTGNDLDSLTRNITMMKILEKCGVPVAHPIPTIDGQEYVVADGNYYLMTNKLPGNHIVDLYEIDYNTTAYETGKIVARLHQSFLACEEKISCWDNSLLGEMKGWIQEVLIKHQYSYISEEDFKATLNELKNCYDELPRQLIHRDLHYGNILFEEGAFSGYIDFDLSQKNIRIFDISYFLMGLLMDHEKKAEDVKVWLHIVLRFIEGYEESNPLTRAEKESISCIMRSIELLFVAYFLGEKDEILAESAASMYYFVKENKEAIKAAVFQEK